MFDGYRSPATASVLGLVLIPAALPFVWTSLVATLMVGGGLAGAAFGVVAVGIAVVASPLVLDRHGDAITAANASLKAATASPVPMALWPRIVMALSMLDALPAVLGLAVVLPVRGHATWHPYRKVMVD